MKKHQASNKNLLFGDTDKYKLMEAFESGWDGALPFTMLIDPTGFETMIIEERLNPIEKKLDLLTEQQAATTEAVSQLADEVRQRLEVLAVDQLQARQDTDTLRRRVLKNVRREPRQMINPLFR